MEGDATIFNDAAVLVSAGAAAISAFFAGLAFLFSKRVSRREMVDTLKLEILLLVSVVEGREAWIEMVNTSKIYEGGGVGPRVNRLAGLLGVIYQSKLKSKRKGKSEYEKDKWMVLIPVALEELKKEGYKNLLGL